MAFRVDASGPMRTLPAIIRNLMSKLTAAGAVLLLAGLLLLAGCGSSEEESSGPARYEVEPFNGWPPESKEKKVGGYVENSWYDPAAEDIVFAVDSRASEGAGSPLANAELGQLQTSKLPGYRERTLKKVKLGGRPAVLWAYDVAGESHVDFFFEECDTSFVVRGTTSPIAYEALSESFREMASTIKAKCDE
jgi:hypothetical protein